MRAYLLGLAFGVASASAAGRGVAMVPTDNYGGWNAPWYIKATFAFYIIWVLVCFAQLVWIIYRLKVVPSAITLQPSSAPHQPAPQSGPQQQYPSPLIRNIQPRLPYILLAIITALLTLAYILWAALERTGLDATRQKLSDLLTATNFFLYFNFPGHAAVLFWLTHQRAQHFHSQSQAQQPYPYRYPKPFILRSWKRWLDWGLVVITYIFGLAWLAILATRNNATIHHSLSYEQSIAYKNALNGLDLAETAMVVILTLDITITLIALCMMEKKRRFKDPISSRLLSISIPFLVLFALEWLCVDVYEIVVSGEATLYIYFFQAIFEGLCSVGITLGCILTMGLYDPALTSFKQNAQPGMVWNGYGMVPYGQQPYGQPQQGWYGPGMGMQQGWYGPGNGMQQGWYGPGNGPGIQQGWYGPGMQQAWHGPGIGMRSQGETNPASTTASGGISPPANPNQPTTHSAGGSTSALIATPGSGTASPERVEDTPQNQPFRIPG